MSFQKFLITAFALCLTISMARADEKIYTVGVVPQFETPHTIGIWQPILEKVSALSGITIQLKTSPSIPEFERQFENGEFDFAYMNPYHLIIANQKQGYIPIIRDTGRNLFGIIVVKKDSSIQSIKELDGKTVAFPAPNALGAALIPRTEFSRKYGIKVNELYAKSHSSVYYNVILGIADAGGGVQKTLSQQPDEIKNQLRVLYKTIEVPPHPFSSHPRVDKNDIEKIAGAFIELGQSRDGKMLLDKIPIRRVGPASLSEYNMLKEMGLAEFYVRE